LLLNHVRRLSYGMCRCCRASPRWSWPPPWNARYRIATYRRRYAAELSYGGNDALTPYAGVSVGHDHTHTGHHCSRLCPRLRILA